MPKNWIVSFLSVLVLLATGSQGQSTQSQKNMATFVIEGKILDITRPSEKSPSVAILQLSSARKTPPSIGQLVEGQSIRVILQSGDKLTKGHSYTFYATGAGISDMLTVREVAHGPIIPSTGFTFTAIEPDALQRYIAADVLLRARVLAVPPLALNDAPSPSFPSEHAPQYKKVSLQVDEIVRGQLQHSSAKQLDILIATNPDIAYAPASGQPQPPVAAGSTKVFALTWDEQMHSYVAVDQVDIRPLDELKEIKSAVNDVVMSKKPK